MHNIISHALSHLEPAKVSEILEQYTDGKLNAVRT